jgi:hypothetical protein
MLKSMKRSFKVEKTSGLNVKKLVSCLVDDLPPLFDSPKRPHRKSVLHRIQKQSSTLNNAKHIHQGPVIPYVSYCLYELKEIEDLRVEEEEDVELIEPTVRRSRIQSNY